MQPQINSTPNRTWSPHDRNMSCKFNLTRVAIVIKIVVSLLLSRHLDKLLFQGFPGSTENNIYFCQEDVIFYANGAQQALYCQQYNMQYLG